jgi:hypothetical protein
MAVLNIDRYAYESRIGNSLNSEPAQLCQAKFDFYRVGCRKTCLEGIDDQLTGAYTEFNRYRPRVDATYHFIGCYCRPIQGERGKSQPS